MFSLRNKKNYLWIIFRTPFYLELWCILGTANERWSPSLSFQCLILLYLKKVPMYCWGDRVFQSSHGKAQPRIHNLTATFCTIFKPGHSNHSTTVLLWCNDLKNVWIHRSDFLAYICIFTFLYISLFCVRAELLGEAAKLNCIVAIPKGVPNDLNIWRKKHLTQII